MKTHKTCGTCSDSKCAAQERRPGEGEQEYQDRQALQSRMCRIKHKVMVLSGKGGVGKSTVAVNLATGLALAGRRVGLLDIDIHGPSVPRLLDLEGATVSGTVEDLHPVKVDCGAGALSVMSIGFLLHDRDEAVIWRGPRKHGLIRQFLQNVEWGELDYLVVDSPPGTGDEPLAVAQLIGKADGAVVVTTPQEVAVQDVRKCIVFCRQLELPVLAVVENMSGFTCPRCGELVRIFGADGGRTMAEEMGVPYLGAIPIDPEVVMSGDRGRPMVQAKPHSEAARAFGRIIRKLLEPELRPAEGQAASPEGGCAMRIAVSDGRLAKIRFKSFGCPGAIATSSMLTALAEGRTIEEALRITDDDVIAALGGIPENKRHCSLLGVRALQAAIEDRERRLRDREGRP